MAVTALAGMPGRPLLAVGLADGQLSVLLAHMEAHAAHGARSLQLLPLDLKHLARRPITHLAFSDPPPARGGRGGGEPLLAVGCSTDGSVHILEMAEPETVEVTTTFLLLAFWQLSLCRAV